MRHPMSSAGQSEITVTISGEINLETGRIQAFDNYGNEVDIDATMRPKGTGTPRIGEVWICTKRFGRWTLGSMVGIPPLPTITGDRTTMDPTVSRLIDILAEKGLVLDGTTPAPES